MLQTDLTSALTLQLVLSLRKFVSLNVSIVYFQHTFTTSHWIGTILAIGGGFLYSISPLPKKPQQKLKNK